MIILSTTKLTSFVLFFLILSLTVRAQNADVAMAQLAEIEVNNPAKVFVLGTKHFDKTILETENQSELKRLIELLAVYKPTKVVVEWEPSAFKSTNTSYQNYLGDSSLIQTKYNEVYQLGFRLAKVMKHDRIYLFDDKTEYIGSLKDFSFEALAKYAEENDQGFYDKHIDLIGAAFNHNQALYKKLGLFDEIVLRNSPKAQKFNALRMHAYEVRVGIQKNWIGPDWLGRFYRRNIRMMANVLKFSEPEDRLLIIVGDNHKWILDELFENTPDFELVPSWDFLSRTN